MLTDNEIKNYCFQLAKQGICQGNCEEHRGQIRVTYTSGWGYFPYCEEAVAEDIRRGFIVEICND